VKIKIMHFIAGSIWPFIQDYQAYSQLRNDALLYILLLLRVSEMYLNTFCA
jgi:hypothetical protein